MRSVPIWEPQSGSTAIAWDVSPRFASIIVPVAERRHKMSQAYVSNRVHMIFSTHNREGMIAEEVQPKLWAYIAGIGRKIGMVVFEVGGVADHSHLLIDVPPTLTLSAAAQKLKANSSRWMHEQGMKRFEWQRGFSGFSVSASATDEVRKYIQTQPEHHAKHTFDDELKSLLARYGLRFNPRDPL
jgi:putative transposase